MKRVLDVGQCQPDHAAIQRLIEGNFRAQVIQADGMSDTLEHLRAARYDLVLVNRKLDCDNSDGLEIIRRIKSEPAVAAVPVMLVSNFSDSQQEAVAAGAEAGFGKSELSRPETRERLIQFLG